MTDAPADNSGEFVELNMGPAPADGEAATPTADTPPADDAPPPSKGEEGNPADETADGDKGDKSEAEDPLRDEKGRYKGGAAGRINELTRARREAERAAEYWKGIATQNGAQPGDDAAPKSKPSPDDFEDYGEYVEALTDWKVSERERQHIDTRASDAASAAETSRATEWGAKIGEAKTSIADFDAVMEAADTPTSPHVANAIMDADRGPELLYHLAKNPALVEQLNDMSPFRAAMELGRIEATLAEPAASPAPPPPPRDVTQTKAPAPITPVPPGSTTTKDPATMNQAEYNDWRKSQGIR